MCMAFKKVGRKTCNMYKRKIEEKLELWFNETPHKPIVVKGVRQCGKTSSVVAFAQKLYYFHKDGGIELDFLMRYKGKCTPVECKATTGNAKSLRVVLNNPDKYHVNSALKLGDYNIGRKDNLLTMPMYMAFLLTEV